MQGIIRFLTLVAGDAVVPFCRRKILMLELLDGFFRTLSLVIGMAVNTGAGSNFRMKEYL